MSSIPMLAGAAMCALATSTNVLVLGRLLCGASSPGMSLLPDRHNLGFICGLFGHRCQKGICGVVS